MEKDVKYLRQLRKHQEKTKSKISVHESRKDDTVQAKKQRSLAFQKINLDYSPDRLARILKTKLSEDKRLSAQLVNQITKSMVQNYGGCPV